MQLSAKHHYICAGSGIQLWFRDADLCSSSSIHAVPHLVWSRNEAIVMAEVQLQHTPHRKATLSTSHLQTIAHAAHFELLGQGRTASSGWHRGQEPSSGAIGWRQKEGLDC